MTDHESMLRAICEQPADTWRRLLLADYLEYCGQDARAEFVRLSCKLAETHQNCKSTQILKAQNREPICPQCQRREQIAARIEQLFAAMPDTHPKTKSSTIDELVPTPWHCVYVRVTQDPNARFMLTDFTAGNGSAEVWIERGFIDRIECTTADFMANAAQLFACQPITGVLLTDCDPVGTQAGNFRFYNAADDIHPTGYAHGDVPPEVFSFLIGPSDVRNEIRSYRYDNAAAAYRALSAAAVAFGRQAAGLPPLSTSSSESEGTSTNG